MEKIAYSILGVLALGWVAAMLTGMIMLMPFGLIGLIAIVGFGLLIIKAVKDRIANQEDDYYSKNVDQ